MKTKFLTTIIASLLVSQAMMAQFHIGLKGGANIFKVDGQSFKNEFRYGYHLGGFIELGLGGRLSFNPEVLFNQYSTTLDSSFDHIYQNVFNPSYQKNVKLNYLAIPLVLDYKLIGPLSLQAGPQVGILIDKNKNLLQNGGNAFKNGDFALIAGAQLKLSALRITGRYVVGLNNINDIDKPGQVEVPGFSVIPWISPLKFSFLTTKIPPEAGGFSFLHPARIDLFCHVEFTRGTLAIPGNRRLIA